MCTAADLENCDTFPHTGGQTKLLLDSNILLGHFAAAVGLASCAGSFPAVAAAVEQGETAVHAQMMTSKRSGDERHSWRQHQGVGEPLRGRIGSFAEKFDRAPH